MKSVPSLSWVGLKTHPTSTPNKNSSGRSTEQTEALAFDKDFVPTVAAPVEPIAPVVDFPNPPPSSPNGDWRPVGPLLGEFTEEVTGTFGPTGA